LQVVGGAAAVVESAGERVGRVGGRVAQLLDIAQLVVAVALGVGRRALGEVTDYKKPPPGWAGALARETRRRLPLAWQWRRSLHYKGKHEIPPYLNLRQFRS
jgi:hypothetical protein